MSSIRGSVGRLLTYLFNRFPDYRDECRRLVLGFYVNHRIGKILRSARESAGQSLKDAASIIGIHWFQLRLIERGSAAIPLCDFSALIEFYGAHAERAVQDVNDITIDKWELLSRIRQKSRFEMNELKYWIEPRWETRWHTPKILKPLLIPIGVLLAALMIRYRTNRNGLRLEHA